MQSPSQPRTYRREEKKNRVLLYTTEKLLTHGLLPPYIMVCLFNNSKH